MDVAKLTDLCFSESYWGQEHHAAFFGDEMIAHVGMDVRVISYNDKDLPVGAVGWVCSHPEHRGEGLIAALMGAMHEKATRLGLPFCALYGGWPEMYAKWGYRPVPNLGREDGMVKSLTERAWDDAAVVDVRGRFW